MKFAFISTALLSCGMATAAPAIDGWYLSAFGGYSYFTSNLSLYRADVLLSDVRYRNGYNIGGRVGFQSNPIRYEFEYTYLSANPDRLRVNYIRQPTVTGNINVNALMANIYIDFPEFLEAISPFVGVGIGYSFLNANIDSAGPLAVTFFNASDNAFTYQGTAGLTYNFSENYAINAAYRYMATSSNNTFGKNLQVQMGSAGIVYRFDQPCYK
ncbi:MAG: hypothetical protein BGO90_14210 [Legionella sp. 40-6]|mgnify:CR=1 FL=1|nr:porin family protein [Legionella sp.]OJY49549.1 MAG: hypothetical protein BGO90_14210 [Legionella sp. 40-6]